METPIQVASRVQKHRLRQPTSVTVLSQRDIESSGARTLNELLTRLVPGYFAVEDIDDTIAGFRGLAADSNSKTMLLLNGEVLNAEWFWGPPDAILNGFNLDYIERIEIQRGPGSVTLGPGALLGVINIITKHGQGIMPYTTMLAGGGRDGYAYAGAEHAADSDGLKTFFHFSSGQYHGQPLRSEGAALGTWAGIRQTPDNALRVFQGGGRLKKTDGELFVGQITRGDFDLTLLWVDQTRDLYNYYRDRNIYEQILTSAAVTYRVLPGEAFSFKLKTGFENDDYILHSHVGTLMGGVRETRYSLQALCNMRFGRVDMAIGGEAKRYDMGRRDRNGNNFILNIVGPMVGESANPGHLYVIPDTVDVKSLFAESYFSPSEAWDFFGAVRYDAHPHWGSSWTPRLGVLYHPSRAWGLRFSYQTGFRGAPGVHYSGGFQGDGLIRSDNYEFISSATKGAVPDPGKVQPERMKNVELELRCIPDWRWEILATLFRNTIDHVIDYATYSSVKGDPGFPSRIGSDIAGDWVSKSGYWFYKSNPGLLVSQGLELVAQRKTMTWETRFSYSKVQLVRADPGNIGTMYLANSNLVGNHFKGYPEDVFRAHVSRWFGTGLNVDLSWLYYPRWYTSDRSMDGNHLVNVALTRRFGQLKMVLVIGNIFNQVHPYPMTARTGINEASQQTYGSPSVERRTCWLKLRWVL